MSLLQLIPHDAARRVLTRVFVVCLGCVASGVLASGVAPVSLICTNPQGAPVPRVSVDVNGRVAQVWRLEDGNGFLTFRPASAVTPPAGGTVYLAVAYVDRGYGKLNVRFMAPGHEPRMPDRFLKLSRSDTGNLVTARMRITGVPAAGTNDWSVRIGIDEPDGVPLAVQDVTLRDTPFDDPDFGYLISDPWSGPYRGPVVKPADNTTLKGKVMAGYQGWFRTPNDLEGRGWVHWGDIRNGIFATDMWPDVSQYPPSVLDKAADVKLKSGKQAYLFSSTWPAVVDTHFRWMREHDIDGAFLQRFVSDRLHSVNGAPEWVLANVRAAASREGRIWAVEYDVSGCPDDLLLDRMKNDWKWLVDGFRLLEDPNYAREGGRPVVFIWGLPFADRNISLETANAVVDFFKNDPKYGGNHVIGGIPSVWRMMNAGWQGHFRNYETILTWMPKSYERDQADFKKLGIAYYPHVKPGFSWANLKHLPTGDDSLGYTPRRGGDFYWNQLTDAANAGADRLFVGMFDEYDEGTAIMPMSDDAPHTPVRPGVGAIFHDGAEPQETGDIVWLPRAELELGKSAPSRRTGVDHFFVNIVGRIEFPAAGEYTFSVDGAAGDDVELFLNGNRVLKADLLDKTAKAENAVSAGAGDSMAFRLQYRHRTGKGVLRLCWEAPGMSRRPVEPAALRDAWGRFITNEGKSPDWWLRLTTMGKELISGARKVSDAAR